MQSIQSYFDEVGNVRLHTRNYLVLQKVSKKLILKQSDGTPFGAAQLQFQKDNIRANADLLKRQLEELQDASIVATRTLLGQTAVGVARSLHGSSRLVVLAASMRESLDVMELAAPASAVGERTAFLEQVASDIHNKVALNLRDLLADLDSVQDALIMGKLGDKKWQDAVDTSSSFILKRHSDGVYTVPGEYIQ